MMIFKQTIYKRAWHWTGLPTSLGLVISLSFALCFFLGCSSSKQPTEPDVSETKATERPPLRIRVIGEPELERELTIRWAAASDQPLQIQNLSLSQAYDGAEDDFDIVLFPGQLMGHFVGKNLVSRLPNQVLVKVDAILQPERANSETNSKGKGGEAWPTKWRTSGGFGGRLYAVPLGLKMAAAIGLDVDWQPIAELSNQLGNSKDLTSLAIQQWSSVLSKLEAKTQNRRSELDARVNELFSQQLSTQASEFLVARFLWIASTTDARRKGLFDLNRLEGRLDQPDLIAAAKILVRLARLNPDGVLGSMETAWNELWSGAITSNLIAIGRPAVNRSESVIDTDRKDFAIAPHIHSSGETFLASIGTKTKQTSVSIRFLTWLCERDQREAFRKVCSHIDVLPGQFDSASVREDFRAFQAAEARATYLEGMELSLRLANANQYRAALSDTLAKAILQPERIEDLMQDCAKRWESITESLGRELQRLSEERSQGFEK